MKNIRVMVAAALLLVCGPAGILGQGGLIRITGYVRDGDGNPIDLVVVQVKNTLTVAMTDHNGYYSLRTAPADSLSLLYSLIGYNKAERIIPSARQDIRLNVQMNIASISLGEVSITAARRQISTMEHVDADRIKLIPDPSGGSIESLVVTYAGVSSANELSSQYSVRGGSFDENIVYVNGLEVFRPLLIRSGQQEGLSFVNPDLTGSVSFAAGGFGARYGDKMSSVLDIAYKKPRATEGSVSASLLGVNAYVGGSAGRFTHVTGLRYKTSRSLLGTLDTNAEYDPVFLDLQTYMTFAIAPGLEVNFLGNAASNSFRFIPRSRSTSFGTEKNAVGFNVDFNGREQDNFRTLFGALTLKYNPSERIETGLQFSAFNSEEEESYDITGSYLIGETSEDGTVGSGHPLEVGVYHEHARNRLRATVMNAGHYGSFRSEGNTLAWGLTMQAEIVGDRINEWEMRDSAGYSLPRRDDGLHVISNLYSANRITSRRFSAYAEDVFKFRSRQGLFTLTAGVRGSYWTYSREFIFSPRASLGFIPNFNQNLTFRLATGLYYQPPFYKELRRVTQDGAGNSVVELNRDLLSQRSIHIIAGGDYVFRVDNRNFRLSAEAYYKKLDNLNPYTVDNVKIRYYGENCATGYAAGLDVKLFGEFVPGVDSWLSISLMKARQTIRNQTVAPLPNSPGYSLSLFFQDYFPGYDRVRLNLRGMLSGRLPVTAPRQGYENGYYQTTPYRRLDAGMSYRLTGGSGRGLPGYLKNLWIGVDVFNLLDISNVSSYLWITDVHDRQFAVPNYLTGRRLNFRLIAEF